MLSCTSCNKITMEVSEIDSKKEGIASYLLLQRSNFTSFLEPHTSCSADIAFDLNTRVVCIAQRPVVMGVPGSKNVHC